MLETPPIDNTHFYIQLSISHLIFDKSQRLVFILCSRGIRKFLVIHWFSTLWSGWLICILQIRLGGKRNYVALTLWNKEILLVLDVELWVTTWISSKLSISLQCSEVLQAYNWETNRIEESQFYKNKTKPDSKNQNQRTKLF